MKHFPVSIVDTFDIGRRIAPKKRNDRHALVDTDCDLFFHRKVENQIHAEWFVGKLTDPPNLVSKQRWRCELLLQNSQPPALLTAATNSGPVRSGPIGAAMIGYSMPRSWQN